MNNGSELKLFEDTGNWKAYFSSFIKPLLGKEVAEIGAGIGSTTSFLYSGQQEKWFCVEPDKQLAKQLEQKIENAKLPPVCHSVVGYSSSLDYPLDSLVYIDVIEHIENDRKELQTAADLLRRGGRLVVLVPAHQALYSPFDKSIGHYRRYNRTSLQAVVPESLVVEKLIYLDSVGYFASLLNKLYLKQSMPTKQQVLFWDQWLVPASRFVDRLTGFRFGKSLLLIARKK